MFREQESPSVWKKEIGKKTRRILLQATCIIQGRSNSVRFVIAKSSGCNGQQRYIERGGTYPYEQRYDEVDVVMRRMRERTRGNLMIARWIYGEMMDCGRRVGRRRGRVCVVSIPRSGPASIDHLGLL